MELFGQIHPKMKTFFRHIKVSTMAGQCRPCSILNCDASFCTDCPLAVLKDLPEEAILLLAQKNGGPGGFITAAKAQPASEFPGWLESKMSVCKGDCVDAHNGFKDELLLLDEVVRRSRIAIANQREEYSIFKTAVLGKLDLSLKNIEKAEEYLAEVEEGLVNLKLFKNIADLIMD